MREQLNSKRVNNLQFVSGDLKTKLNDSGNENMSRFTAIKLPPAERPKNIPIIRLGKFLVKLVVVTICEIGLGLY